MAYWNSLPSRFKHATFDTFKPCTKEQAQALLFLKKYADHPLSYPNNVILLGNCGTGKTHLAYSVLKQNALLIEDAHFDTLKSEVALFVSLKEILDEIKENFQTKPTYQSLYQKAIEAPLLILDEIGLQYGTEMERTELYRLFNERYNAFRPIMALSNLNEARLNALLGQRIFERLFSNARVFHFQNQSYRFQKEGEKPTTNLGKKTMEKTEAKEDKKPNKTSKNNI